MLGTDHVLVVGNHVGPDLDVELFGPLNIAVALLAMGLGLLLAVDL
jgi:hypothetical protein